MFSCRAGAVLVLSFAACSSNEAPPPPPAPVAVPVDAGLAGITTIAGFDPSSGMHLDEDVPSERRAINRKHRPGRPVDIVLKSTPPGAIAAVDGRQLGPTPVYWDGGVADGREHDFTFVLSGHATARYRFVPLQSGVVHARLEPIAVKRVDAGVPPRSTPQFVPLAPPPTVLGPVDAGVRALPDAAAAPPPVAPSDPGGAGPQP